MVQRVITPGMRVLCRDAEWLVTEVHAEKTFQTVHCVGADDLVRGHEAAFLTLLDDIVPIDPRATRLVRDGGPRHLDRARLFLEAQLRQMPLTDPEPRLDGMGAFKPMNYQKEAVHRALLQMRPRLLLADQVGLGKTIEVGMILSELMRRGRANRILVLAKKSMLTQFQAELWNRFAIPLVRMDSVGVARLRLKIPASRNPFEVYHRVIISMDTLKDVGRYRHFLEDTRWDVVVIDEAHNVAAAANPEKQLNYRLARLLSRRTDSLILTTATPHNGKRETFGRLITLLDWSAIPDPKLREYGPEDIAPFFLMRFKEDVRGEAGDQFAERQLAPLAATTLDATEEEEAAYAELGKLRARAKAGQYKTEAIIQWGLYKRFLSSPEACLSTVTKRIATLDKTPDRADEAAALATLKSRLSRLSIADSSRFQLLARELKAMGWTGKTNSPRVLLFTESAVTQMALARALARRFGLPFSDKHEDQPKQVMAIIHGGQPDVTLAKTVEAFGTGSSPMRLLLATDVASEGVNLHHECHNIIHYDLPWSIITLIQRNGRIDRFGQCKNPVIRYLMIRTQSGELKGDEELFSRLVEKVEEINRSTRTGESVLKLYDPEAEEAWIAEQGLLAGDAAILDKTNPRTAESAELENALLTASQEGHEDFLAFLLAATPTNGAPAAPAKPVAADNSRLRLLDDARFLEDGYRYLRDEMANIGDNFRHWHPIEKTDKLWIFSAPPELKRRLGATDADEGVIFGSTAIPEEAWPEQGRFHFTTDPERVNTAIRAALAMKGQWSHELLLTEQHPVMRWLAERLMMLMPRGEAPLIASPHLQPGELCFCFIGQVSARAGTPLIVDAHAISFQKGGGYHQQALKDALARAGFDKLADTGRHGAASLEVLQGFVSAAVEESLRHLNALKEARRLTLKPVLDKEEARLERWRQRRLAKLDEALSSLSAESKQAALLRNEKDEIERYLKDRREHWRDAHFEAAPEPTTRLVLAVEGV
ncbi:MAG: SNF2-related protein [Methylococcus sp.]